jgi:hypothetical protein
MNISQKSIISTITLIILGLLAGYVIAIEKYSLNDSDTYPTPSPWGYIETPAPSGCYYKQIQCIRAPCNPILVCPSTTIKPSCNPRPPCLDTKPACKLPEPEEGWCK